MQDVPRPRPLNFSDAPHERSDTSSTPPPMLRINVTSGNGEPLLSFEVNLTEFDAKALMRLLWKGS